MAGAEFRLPVGVHPKFQGPWFGALRSGFLVLPWAAPRVTLEAIRQWVGHCHGAGEVAVAAWPVDRPDPATGEAAAEYTVAAWAPSWRRPPGGEEWRELTAPYPVAVLDLALPPGGLAVLCPSNLAPGLCSRMAYSLGASPGSREAPGAVPGAEHRPGVSCAV
jgi:hypothetical protein